MANINIYEDQVIGGYLTVDAIYNDGRKVNIFTDDPNLIMRKSKRKLLSFLYNETAVPDILTRFKIGIGGTMDSEGKRPLRPDGEMTDLYSPIAVNHSTITIIPSTNKDATDHVLVVFSLNQDEGNDLRINEVGLFTASGDMFNIKTFRSITKNESFSLQFSWRIVFYA